MFEALEKYHQEHKDRKISSLMNNTRFDEFSSEVSGLVLDYSKTNLCATGMGLLFELAQSRQVQEMRDEMMRGEKINTTEDRAVLHTALRSADCQIIKVDGENVVKAVHSTLARMRQFSQDLRSGELRGSTGKKITDIVNIGIGGSDLGPVMVVKALAPYHDGPNIHFVSNIDSADIHDTLAKLNPEKTVILIASKTFTTIETMTNAKTALAWLRDEVEDVSLHIAAISSEVERAVEFGCLAERVFGFEDWVGGRYSLWGPIGLSIMLAIGCENFQELLNGAHDMDRHFQNAKSEENLPLIMGLIGVYHRNICHYPTRAILPYEQRLSRLPAYLQQLDMESNGKSVNKAGEPLQETGPIVWGEPGTNGQHAFYQLIHQGTDVIPCEFMMGVEGHEEDLRHQHDLLKANCLAQSRALMIGRSYDEARAIVEAKGYEGDEAHIQAMQRVFPGNRPSLTLVYPKLTPFVLGQIIALYEHRVFVEGMIWGINSFDQWGVELGKELALSIAPAFDGVEVQGLDASTEGLLRKLQTTQES